QLCNFPGNRQRDERAKRAAPFEKNKVCAFCHMRFNLASRATPDVASLIRAIITSSCFRGTCPKPRSRPARLSRRHLGAIRQRPRPRPLAPRPPPPPPPPPHRP